MKSILAAFVRKITFWAWKEEIERLSWWVPKVRKLDEIP